MPNILEEMIGKDGKVDLSSLLLEIEALKKRVSLLEDKNSYGGVYVDGSTTAVKEYYKNILEAEEKIGKGDVDGKDSKWVL